MWFYYALLSAVFAAFTAIFAKMGVSNINSNLATGIRTVIILVLVWSIVFIKGESNDIGSLSKFNLIFLVLSGVATGLSWLFYFKALQIGKVSQVAAVDKLSVAIAIILSIFFFKETLTLKTAIGALLIIGGTILLAFK
ncbi:EamA family transporter [Cloacibacterium sp. Arc13]|uniref:Membrane protein n=4 Tax=Chryseobacterium group TaxID=2782232 RepID=A0A085B5W4_9FLAO|nr:MULTISPECIES: EamA family transporter [Chryseobacterium group]AZA63108.1 EamA family transporter [Chryseobacterium indoltheticum]AZA93780.1 EamA family transporter [Chryseobacterium nakagawai]KFC17859.1 membrane protein [Epilithonimonas lactis]